MDIKVIKTTTKSKESKFQTSISDLPSYLLFIDSILPLYFSLYPVLQEWQQKKRSRSANFKTLGLSNTGP